jgi:hypothetical protein
VKFKIADIALALIIAGAIGVIGWRLMSSQDKSPDQVGQEEATEVSVVQPVVPPLSSIETKVKPSRRSKFGHRAHMVLDSQIPVSASAIQSFAKSAGVPVKQKSSACNRADIAVEAGLPILSSGLRQKIESQKGGLLLSYGIRRCYESGSVVEVLYFGDEDVEPYVERLGSFEIKELIELDYAKIKPTVWSELGIAAADFADLKNPKTAAVLLRVERKGASSFKETDLPTYHFRYLELTKENASLVLKSDHVVLDLRSRAEAAKVAIPNAISFDYGDEKASDKAVKFGWDVKLSRLAEFKFNIGTKLELARDPSRGKSKVIVVGNGPGDGRVYWLLRELSIAGVSNVYWYDGEAAALTPFLKK